MCELTPYNLKKMVLYCYILFILPIDSIIFQKFNMYSYIEAKRIY